MKLSTEQNRLKLVANFNQLKSQLAELQIKPKQWFKASDIFNSDCFHNRSDELKDYLQELEANISQLEHISKTEQFEFLTERIIQQFACFKNLFSAYKVNIKNQQYKGKVNTRVKQVKAFTQKATQSSQELYTELSRLQEYERRLFEMLTEKQTQLSRYSGQVKRVDYQQQVLQTQQRLGRCRQAINKIEELILKLDQGN